MVITILAHIPRDIWTLLFGMDLLGGRRRRHSLQYKLKV